jgi:hypothetical protein
MPDLPADEPAGLGYIVGEDAGRPTLEREVGAHGPLDGTALHRLAIVTMTGLAALHREGVVHGAVRPETILLGPEGPRLRRPAAGETAGPALDEETVAAGTLTWSTPEHLKGLPAGTAGDVFTWAATMVFAATGRSPFGTGSVTATVNRLLHGAADLGPLDGVLRELVADCLAADPAERPTAEDALLRLIGYSGALDTALPAAAPEPPRPPERRSRAAILAAAGLAVALVSAGVTYLLLPTAGTTPRPVRASVAPAATVAGTPTPLPAPAGPISLPTGGTLYERPGDLVRLVSYRTGETAGRSVAYARAPGTSRFERVAGDNADAVVSPDDRWLATVNELSIAVSDRQVVSFTDRVTGERFALPVAGTPDLAQLATWSRDSRRLLLTVVSTSLTKGMIVTHGFAMLDVVARTSTFVTTDDAADAAARGGKQGPLPVYSWTPDGKGVASFYITPEGLYGVRFRDLTGRATRSMHWVGNPIGDEWFSPSGRLFMTTGCGAYTTCVWDTATGVRRATIPGKKERFGIGWYDESHTLRGSWSGKDVFRVAVVDFKGKEERVLLELKSPGRRLPSLTFIRGVRG